MAEAPERGRLKRLFKNTAIYGFGDIAIKLTTAFLAPIYTVLLAPEEFGIWSLGVMAITGLSFLYNPALHGAVNRFYYDHENDEVAKRRFQSTINTFLLSWGLVLTGVLWVTGPWIFDQLFEGMPFDPYGSIIVWVAFFNIFSVVPKATWTAAERSKAFVGINMLASGVNVFGALAFLVLAKVGVIGLFWAKLMSVIIVSWPCGKFIWKNIGIGFNLSDMVAAFRFSLPLVPHLVAHWGLSMADRFILEHFLGMVAVGIYGSAYVFTEAVSLVANSMNRAFVPLFNRFYDKEEERPFIGRSITYFMLAVGSASGVLTVFAPTIVRHLYSDRYAEAGTVASILAVGGFFLGLYLVYVAGLFYYKRNNTIPVITVFAGTVNIVLNILWIPTMGIAGAAWATLIGYMVLVLGVRWACRRVTKLPFETGRLGSFFAVLFVLVAMGVWVDGRLGPMVEIPLKLGLMLSGPPLLHLLGFWSEEELEWFRQKIRRVFKRS